MRCVESCNYQEMPNHMPRLKNHIEHCDKCVPADQISVVWRDGEFVAVRDAVEEAVEIPVILEAYEEPDIPEPVEVLEPPMTTMVAPKKRAKKRDEESDEL